MAYYVAANTGSGVQDAVWAIDEDTLVASVQFKIDFVLNIFDEQIFTNTVGLGWDGSHFWYVNNASESNGGGIYRVSFDGVVDYKLDKPDNQPSSPADDGIDLWVPDFASDIVYQLDRLSGSVKSSFTNPSLSGMFGATWDSDRGNMWISEGAGGGDQVNEVTTNGVIVQSHSLSIPKPGTWGYNSEDGLLWGITNGGGIFTLDPDTGVKTSIGTADYSAIDDSEFGPSLWGFIADAHAPPPPSASTTVPPLRLGKRDDDLSLF